MKFNTIYDKIGRKEGTYNIGESLTDKSQAEDADIYKCIEKYGVTSLVNQTMAQEPLYLDNRLNMNLADAVRMKEEATQYFKDLPAKVRKTFGDNPEIFYEKYKRGEFEDFIETGVLTEKMTKEILNNDFERKTQEINNSNTAEPTANMEMGENASNNN